MLFNPDPSKPVQEVIFQKKKVTLLTKLNFKMHIETVLGKIDKGMSIIKKLKNTLPNHY